jgi:hypothetical protein
MATEYRVLVNSLSINGNTYSKGKKISEVRLAGYDAKKLIDSKVIESISEVVIPEAVQEVKPIKNTK